MGTEIGRCGLVDGETGESRTPDTLFFLDAITESSLDNLQGVDFRD